MRNIFKTSTVSSINIKYLRNEWAKKRVNYFIKLLYIVSMQEQFGFQVDLQSITNVEINIEHFMCPICYTLQVNSKKVVECYQCQRLFCKNDYNQLVKSGKNACPFCKLSPWKISNNIHPIYVAAINNMIYNCKLCKLQQNKQSIKELSTHLLDVHNKTISPTQEVKQYTIIFKNNKKIVLLPLQSAYLSHQIANKSDYAIIGDRGYFNFNFLLNQGPLSGTHSQLGKFQIIQETINQSLPDKDLIAWVVLMDNMLIMFAMQIQQILENGYQKYLKNKIKSEVLFDLAGVRYRVSFIKMEQTNTSTHFKRAIFRQQLLQS